jgi:hypothetical protein
VRTDVVVGAVEVLAGAVAEVRPHHRDPPAGADAGQHALEEAGDLLLVGQVLEEVRDPHGVEVRLGQLVAHGVPHHHPDPLGRPALVVGHQVQRPSLTGGHGVDELAPSRRRIQPALGTSQTLVNEGSDDPPHRFATALVDVPEAVLVQAPVVHAGEA